MQRLQVDSKKHYCIEQISAWHGSEDGFETKERVFFVVAGFFRFKPSPINPAIHQVRLICLGLMLAEVQGPPAYQQTGPIFSS